MSKNSKNAKRNASAKEISKRRQSSGPAGAKTSTPNHKKKNAWWQKFRSYAEFVKGGKKPPRREEAVTDVTEIAA